MYKQQQPGPLQYKILTALSRAPYGTMTLEQLSAGLCESEGSLKGAISGMINRGGRHWVERMSPANYWYNVKFKITEEGVGAMMGSYYTSHTMGLARAEAQASSFTHFYSRGEDPAIKLSKFILAESQRLMKVRDADLFGHKGSLFAIYTYKSNGQLTRNIICGVYDSMTRVENWIRMMRKEQTWSSQYLVLEVGPKVEVHVR